MYNKCELLPGEIDLFRSALKRRVLAYKPHYPLSPALSLYVLSVCAAPSSSNHRSPRVSLSCLLGLHEVSDHEALSHPCRSGSRTRVGKRYLVSWSISQSASDGRDNELCLRSVSCASFMLLGVWYRHVHIALSIPLRRDPSCLQRQTRTTQASFSPCSESMCPVLART